MTVPCTKITIVPVYYIRPNRSKATYEYYLVHLLYDKNGVELLIEAPGVRNDKDMELVEILLEEARSESKLQHQKD